VPVRIHNLSAYDSHLFVKSLGYDGNGQIECIPNNEVKYISFSKRIYGDEGKFKYIFQFKDNFRFMPTGLDTRLNNLESNQFRNTRQAFGDDCELLFRKGVYPYDWVDSFEKFDEK